MADVELETENTETRSPFAACPVCGTYSVLRLVDEWADGRPIPVVGCGNPWHYATRSLGDSPADRP